MSEAAEIQAAQAVKEATEMLNKALDQAMMAGLECKIDVYFIPKPNAGEVPNIQVKVTKTL